MNAATLVPAARCQLTERETRDLIAFSRDHRLSLNAVVAAVRRGQISQKRIEQSLAHFLQTFGDIRFGQPAPAVQQLQGVNYTAEVWDPATGSSVPTPQTCERTRLICNWRTCSAEMRTEASFPKPVLIP